MTWRTSFWRFCSLQDNCEFCGLLLLQSLPAHLRPAGVTSFLPHSPAALTRASHFILSTESELWMSCHAAELMFVGSLLLWSTFQLFGLKLKQLMVFPTNLTGSRIFLCVCVKFPHRNHSEGPVQHCAQPLTVLDPRQLQESTYWQTLGLVHLSSTSWSHVWSMFICNACCFTDYWRFVV